MCATETQIHLKKRNDNDICITTTKCTCDFAVGLIVFDFKYFTYQCLLKFNFVYLNCVCYSTHACSGSFCVSVFDFLSFCFVNMNDRSNCD